MVKMTGGVQGKGAASVAVQPRYQPPLTTPHWSNLRVLKDHMAAHLTSDPGGHLLAVWGQHLAMYSSSFRDVFI